MRTMNRRQFLAITTAAGTGLIAGTSFAQDASKAEYKFKLGTDLPVTHSVNVRLKEAIEAISAESKGKISIQLFPNNQLGSDSDMMSQIRSGALELATFPGTVMSTIVPATSITGVGFAFPNYEKVWQAMDGAIGNHIREAIEKVNLVPFQNVWDNGFRQITTSTKPIKTPDDLKNFKIRVPVVPLWVSMFKSLGASPVSLPLSEAYQALQTKVADGQENPLALIESAKFYEVQKYCSLTNHAWDGFWFIASGRVWKNTPKNVQDIIAKHINAAALKQRSDIAQTNKDIQKKLEVQGLTFNSVDTNAFRAALKSAGFYKEAESKYEPATWALLKQATGDNI